MLKKDLGTLVVFSDEFVKKALVEFLEVQANKLVEICFEEFMKQIDESNLDDFKTCETWKRKRSKNLYATCWAYILSNHLSVAKENDLSLAKLVFQSYNKGTESDTVSIFDLLNPKTNPPLEKEIIEFDKSTFGVQIDCDRNSFVTNLCNQIKTDARLRLIYETTDFLFKDLGKVVELKAFDKLDYFLTHDEDELNYTKYIVLKAFCHIEQNNTLAEDARPKDLDKLTNSNL